MAAGDLQIFFGVEAVLSQVRRTPDSKGASKAAGEGGKTMPQRLTQPTDFSEYARPFLEGYLVCILSPKETQNVPFYFPCNPSTYSTRFAIRCCT